MSKDIVRASNLTIEPSQREFTEAQISALRQLGVENATKGDLETFFHRCQSTGLDPFSGQIYMIARKSRKGGREQYRQTIQTGIDGYRLIAHRSAGKRGLTLSMDDTLWADPNGEWHDLWIWDSTPMAAKVTVHVGESRFSGVASTAEYMPTIELRDGTRKPTGQWAKMPAVMIAKCAEALALRKAFPLDLSGIYTHEEMDQADADSARFTPSRPEGVTVTEHHDDRPDWGVIIDAMKATGANQQQVLEVASRVLSRQVTTLGGLTQDELNATAAALVEAHSDEPEAQEPGQLFDAEVIDENTGEVAR